MDSVALSSMIVMCFLCVQSVFGITFVNGPSDIVATVGQTATLRCRVHNKQSFQVFWRSETHNRYLTADTTFYPNAVNSRYRIIGNHAIGEYFLQITDIQLSDAGHFQCIISPNGSPIPRGARITVYQAPSPNSPVCSSSSSQGQVGHDITISCSSFGAAVPHAHLTWFEGNNVIAETSTLNILSATFTLEARHNGQTFTCRSQHPTHTNERICTIVPLSILPESRIEPYLVQTIVGGKATFTCIASDLTQNLEYSWFYQNRLVNGEDTRFEISRDGRIFVVKNLTLEDNESVVKCRASTINGLFHISMATIDVMISDRQPTVSNRPSTTLATSDMEITTTFELQTLQLEDSAFVKPGSTTILFIILAIVLGQFLIVIIIYIIYRVTNRMKASTAKGAIIDEERLTNRLTSVSTDGKFRTSYDVNPRIINDNEQHYKSLHRYETPPTQDERSSASQAKAPSTSRRQDIDIYAYSSNFDEGGDYQRPQSFANEYEMPNVENPGYVIMRPSVTSQILDPE